LCSPLLYLVTQEGCQRTNWKSALLLPSGYPPSKSRGSPQYALGRAWQDELASPQTAGWDTTTNITYHNLQLGHSSLDPTSVRWRCAHEVPPNLPCKSAPPRIDASQR